MIKPDSLRAFLAATVAQLADDPARLTVLVVDGRCETSLGSPSFRFRYTLRLIVTDFTGPPTALMLPVLLWLRAYQPDLVGDPSALDRQLRFEVEQIDSERCDVQIDLPLSEFVAVTRSADGGHDARHLEEPTDEGFGDVRHWSLWLRERLLATWVIPA